MSVTVVNQTIALGLSMGQGPAGRPPTVSITDIEYDGSDRVISYFLNGVAHTVEYEVDGSGNVTMTDEGGGTTKVVVTDALGRITSAEIS